MAGTATSISPNLVMKATETVLQVEVVNNTFWAPLTRDGDAQYEDKYMKPDSRKPTSIMEKKSKIKEGELYVEFGKRLALVRPGKYDGETLLGEEEKLRNYENRAYFSDVRHGVPFDAKGTTDWTTKKFLQMDDAQQELTDWMVRYFETAAWQGLFLGVNTKTAAKHSTAITQAFHPTVYMAEAGGLAQTTWSATSNTYKTSINTDRGSLGVGDNITYDRIIEAEIAAADALIKPIRVSYSVGGNRNEDECWLWVYPRAARKRIKAALKDVFMYADVRGDSNRAIMGDVVKFGKFLFVESAYIPRITGAGTTLTLQEAWAYDAATDSRLDNRRPGTGDDQGVVHAILGNDALCWADPAPLTFDFEETDYKYKKGIGAYRMFGFRRNETYDSYTTITAVKNNSSLLIVESNV